MERIRTGKIKLPITMTSSEQLALYNSCNVKLTAYNIFHLSIYRLLLLTSFEDMSIQVCVGRVLKENCPLEMCLINKTFYGVTY